MNQYELRSLLEQVARGSVSTDDALLQLKSAPFQDLGFAKPDHHRALRQGVAEVIYGAGKTPAQIASIAGHFLEQGQKTVLITRISPEAAAEVAQTVPLTYHEMGRVAIAGTMPQPDGAGHIVVATGAVRYEHTSLEYAPMEFPAVSDLGIANALVALAGAVMAQKNRVFDISMGTGSMVFGLAAVIIGEVVFGKLFKNFALKLLAISIGAILYYVVIQAVISLSGINSNYLKLLSAVIVALFLSVPYWKSKWFQKPVKKGDAHHA